MQDYIPDADEAFLTWLTQFHSAAAAQAGALGLTPAEVAALAERQAAWAARLAAHHAAREAAVGARTAKDAERAAAERAVRALVRKLAAHGLDGGQRANLGLPPRDTIRTRLAVPASKPVLGIDLSDGGRHAIRFVDAANPLRRGKPRGIAGIALYLKKGGGEPGRDADWTLLAYATRSPYRAIYDQSEAGVTVWYKARWLNPRQEPGPWSAVVSAKVPG